MMHISVLTATSITIQRKNIMRWSFGKHMISIALMISLTLSHMDRQQIKMSGKSTVEVDITIVGAGLAGIYIAYKKDIH